MPKVSVIVPVYNSEKYIEECLNSIINQTLKDLEIIIVDDGSSDSSPQICDEYASKDSRIKVIHKENAGLGVSYNTGINAATGEYIGFIESDDFAQENMYEDLYNLAEKYNPDIIKSAWFMYYTANGNATKDFQMCDFNTWQVINITHYPWLLTKQFSVWSAIYKTDFLKNKNISFLETPGASYQDVAFTYKAFCQSNSMVITPNAYIHYRQDNENSSINSKEKADVIFGEYEEVDRFFNQHPEIKKWANTDKLVKQFWDYNWNYGRIADKYKPDFIKHFAENFRKYMYNGEIEPDFYPRINSKFLFEIIR